MGYYDITFGSVSVPSNSGGASITLLEDSDTDGTVENSDTISLSNGTTSVSTANTFALSGTVAIELDLGPPSDTTKTASVTGPISVQKGITAPSTPQNLTTSPVSDSQISLNWDPVSWNGDQGHYEILRYDGSNYNQVATVSSGTTSYTDGGLLNGEGYYHTVRAQNSAGTSGRSNHDGDTVTNLRQVQGASVSVSGNDVTLTWTDTLNNPRGYYEVYYNYRAGASGPDNWVRAQKGINATSHTFNNLRDGEKMRCIVRSLTPDYGRSDNNFYPTTDLNSPSSGSISVSASGDDISVSWGDSFDNPNGRYKVYWNEDGTWHGPDTVGQNTTSTTINNLLDGEQYNIHVHADTDDYGQASANGDHYATTELPANTGLSASNIDSDTVDLSWNVNTSDATEQRVYTTDPDNPTGMDFNPSNGDYINVGVTPSELNIDGAKQKTFYALVRPDQYNDGGVWEIGVQSQYNEFSFRTTGTEGVWCVQGWSSGDVDFTYGGSDVLQAIAIAYDGTDVHVTADGSDIRTATRSYDTQDDDGMDIGRWDTDDFDGTIYGVAVWDDFLTSSERQTVTNNGPLARPTNLRGYWPLDQNNSGTTPDCSEYANDGTVNGPSVVGSGLTDRSGALSGSADNYTLSALTNGEKFKAFVEAQTNDSTVRDQ